MSEKKKYTKPEVRRVKIAPEEAVLAFCKYAGVNRSTGSRCDDLQGQCINRSQGS